MGLYIYGIECNEMYVCVCLIMDDEYKVVEVYQMTLIIII